MAPDHSYQDHRARYSTAIKNAQSTLQQALEADPQSWKLIPSPSSNSTSNPTSLSNELSSTNTPSGSTTTTASNVLGTVEPSKVKLHKRPCPNGGGPDLVRATLDIHLNYNSNTAAKAEKKDLLESFQVALRTTELRPVWDKLVEQATTLELVDPLTRVIKTDYRLGWPASPRDTVTISQTTTLNKGDYLVDISTSLPRFADEPSFLRPSPPYLRSYVNLYAWVLQILPTPSTTSTSSTPSSFLRIQLFSSWSLNNRFPLTNSIPSTSSSSPSSSSSSTSSGFSLSSHPYQSHIPHLIVSLVQYVKSSSSSSSSSITSISPLPSSSSFSSSSPTAVQGNCRIPNLRNWTHSRGIEMASEKWDESGLRWNGEWDVVYSEEESEGDLREGEEQEGEEEEEGDGIEGEMDGVEKKSTIKGRRGKGKGKELVFVEIGLPATANVNVGGGNAKDSTGLSGGRDGWDIRINSKNLSSSSISPPGSQSPDQGQEEPRYTVSLEARRSGSSSGRYSFKVLHRGVREKDGLERYKVGITRLVGGKGVRVNGLIVPVKVVDESDGANEEDENEEGEEPNERKWGQILRTAAALEDEDASSTGGGLQSPNLSSTPRSSNSVSNSFLNNSSISIRSTTSTMSQQMIKQQNEISTLLRRSYIYFLSLLQEPPAKWKIITDSSLGVTVTQLLSPDPTLTIYRAEAVFVGVGVWDVFASVLSGGKGSWDKGLDESKLVKMAGGANGSPAAGGAGELSEVWWEKRKGNWPVAPRDSVSLRTSYKSPTSIHIFSFSTDDTNLFPNIPPVQPPTIRTQTDLSGWSIESLSPTTTSITLLDQSDPKGWSNKSWTPNQLVQAVSGVRDFTIKFGAPPVVTRLSGARKKEVGYDHEKGMFRVEYESDQQQLYPTGAGGGGSDTSSLAESSSTASTIKRLSPFSTGTGGPQAPIELELRCDVSVWSPQGLELMIDPPPSSVSCLSRHRLSSGGGLWLTIEHPPAIVESEGKVVVTVKKASKGSSAVAAGEKGGVCINGAKVKVDVEVLEEEKIRELEGRKRRKFSPVPLDQYETLGARVWGNSGGGTSEVKKSTGSGIDKGVERRDSAQSTLDGQDAIDEKRRPASIASIDGSAPIDDPSVDAAPVKNPANTDSNTAPTYLASKRPLEPPAAALEALAYLQTFHAEQGPELTDPAPGWSIVSERGGTVVRKKIIPRISEVIPVYRGDKIVQGLTADEIASVITSPGCRKMWDERVDQAIPLASYGNGISTLAISTKPAFPFKGRIFYVSTIMASVKVPSASSTSSTSTVLFVASASYPTPLTTDPASPDSLDPSKVNPNSLLTGQVLLEGWILETLDPYTSSVLAIPSTRCTYLACIDQKGSVPLALNQVLNANLAKSIGNVEAFGKTRGPIPRIWSPSNGVQIEGPLSEDGEGDCVWKLGKGSREGESKVVAANHGEDENTFKALFKIGGKNVSVKEEETVSDRPGTLEKKSSSTTTPTTKSLAVGSTLLKSELPRSASLNFGTAAPPILHKSSVTSELSHKRSRGSLRSKSPAAPPIASGIPPTSSATIPGPAMTPNDPNAHDLVVAEFIVDLKQYPHGYSALASSSLLALPDSSSPSEPLSLDSLPPRSLAPSSTALPVLPLRLTAHDAPLPSILTASLDAWKRANHLVRILVPTSHITHPLQDPLREPSKTRIEKPDWYKLVAEGGGALVEIKILPLPAPVGLATTISGATTTNNERPKLPPGNGSEPTGLGKVTGQANRTVMFNGEKIVVMSQKESRTVLARFEDEDAPLQGAKLSRVARRKRKTTQTPVDADASNVSSLPLELQQPLAIATRLLAPKPSTPLVDDYEFPDPKSPGMMTPAQEVGGRSPVMSKSGSMQPTSNRRSTTSSDSTPLSGPLSAILGSYPLARLGSSIVNAATPSHDSHIREGAVALNKRHYSLGFVIAVALIAFLLGSFLRSLLTPADYIVYHPLSTMSQGGTSAGGGDSVEKALLTAFDPHRRWKEARRLIELRTGFGFIGWDLIVAAVKRE
ncbi:hypothetical protein JCM16303_001234 [Sporobolomyces ruberrimus]